VAWAEFYLRTKWHFDLSSRLATTTWGQKWEGAAVGGAGSPSNTVSPGPRPTSVPSGMLIHPTIWPQYTNVTDRQTGQTGQRPDSIGRTVFSERELTFTFDICYRPSVSLPLCLSVVCNARAPYSGGCNFRQYLRHLVPWPSIDIEQKFYRDRPRATPPLGQLNTTGVAKYSDFGPIEGYISETVQDMR